MTNAKLCLYNVDGASAGGDFHHVEIDSWDEDTVTWNNAPIADAGVLASLGAVSANTWYEVNLTSHITADGTYSLRISDSQGDADYSSKEGANAPKLLVAVAGATPQSCSTTATATPTPAVTNTPTNTPTPGPSPTPTNTSTPTSAPTATQPPPGAFNNATFVYDGDGKRVKSTFNGTTTTYFVGNHYEVTGSTITKYYYAGVQRIAMRTNGTLNYLLGDHLGSTSLVTDATGHDPIETRYKAWGETRYSSGTTPTKYTYTGQYSNMSDFGLMFYNARWYDPSLGRFAQADSIIPGTLNPQSWDRYSYVVNNPLSYNDPSGHLPPLLVVIGVILLISQIPSDVPQAPAGVDCGPPTCGDKNIVIDAVISIIVGFGLHTNPETDTGVAEQDSDNSDWDITLEEFDAGRAAYESEVRAIKDQAYKMIEDGASPKEAAEWAYDQRRQLGMQYKNLTPPDLRDQIYERNIKDFGDPLGPPSIDYFLDRGDTYEQIIESAARPGG